jgi:hypothetical protein
VQVVDISLQPMRGGWGLYQEQMARRQVHRDLRAKGTAGLRRYVHSYVVFAEQLHKRRSAYAVDRLQQVVMVLGGHQHPLAVRCGAAHRHYPGTTTKRTYLAVQRIRHRGWDGAPHLRCAQFGPRERGEKGHQPVQAGSGA